MTIIQVDAFDVYRNNQLINANRPPSKTRGNYEWIVSFSKTSPEGLPRIFKSPVVVLPCPHSQFPLYAFFKPEKDDKDFPYMMLINLLELSRSSSSIVV